MSNNILLISENESVNEIFKKKLVLLRESDKISTCKVRNIKDFSKSGYNIIILYANKNQEQTLKYITQIKNFSSNSVQIILLLDKYDSDLLYKAYDAGIYDFISLENDNLEITFKVMNCMNYVALHEINDRNNAYLSAIGILDYKTGLYKTSYIKEIFENIKNNLKFKNGVFSIITLDSSIKTKVSINRLALCIKKLLRSEDIATSDKNGYFYLIFPDTDIIDAQKIINKIQNSIGDKLKIRAGLSKIGVQSYNEIEKFCKDCIIDATKSDTLCSTIIDSSDQWIDLGDNKKSYKLFKVLYENKLKYIVEPLFFKAKKECSKNKKSSVNYYSNTVESLFNIHTENVQSELIIRFDGYSTLKIKITHSGLETPENTDMTMTLKKFTTRELSKLLKKLQEEHKQSLSQETTC